MHSNGVRSILTINIVTLRDDGKYRCTATNVDAKSAESNEVELISKLFIATLYYFIMPLYSYSRNHQQS